MKTKTKKWLEIAKHHAKLDAFVKGKWLTDEPANGIFKGCCLGCMIQEKEDVVKKASEQMELPQWLLSVFERIFEGLPVEESKRWPVQFFEVAEPGRNYTANGFFYRLLADPDRGQATFTAKGSEQEKAILQVAELFRTGDYTNAELAESAARSAARSAAESAARSAAESAAESAAWSAAESAAW
jgi:hypothetical protein